MAKELPKDKFVSRYADPNHPANSGSLISLVTGGLVNPPSLGGRRSGGGFGGRLSGGFGGRGQVRRGEFAGDGFGSGRRFVGGFGGRGQTTQWGFSREGLGLGRGSRGNVVHGYDAPGDGGVAQQGDSRETGTSGMGRDFGRLGGGPGVGFGGLNTVLGAGGAGIKKILGLVSYRGLYFLDYEISLTFCFRTSYIS